MPQPAIILSNRLRALRDSAENFGDSIAGIREQQRLAARQGAQDKMAGESHALAMRQGNTAAGLGDLQFKQAQDQQAAGVEAQGFADQLQGFGQDVPEQAISLPGMQTTQSPRPAADPTADNLKDRLRASMENATAKANGKVSALTAADIRTQRTEATAKKQRDAEEYALSIDKTKADIEGTKAGTSFKLMESKKAEADIKKTEAEIAKMASGGMDPDKAYQIESGLQGKFIQQTQGFQKVRDSYSKIQVAEPTAAGDMSLVYGYMTILDPGSSVKEGEFATAENAGGVTDKVRNLYNAALNGTRLQPGQRDQFKSQAGKIFDSQKKIYDSTKAAFDDIATRYHVDPTRVTVDLSGGVSNSESASGVKSFKSAREAMAAGLPAGTRVMINGEEAEM